MFTAIVLFLATASLAAASCPSNSFEYQDNCYVYQSSRAIYANADLACTDLNGHLVSIHDGWVNSMVMGQASTKFSQPAADFWIGLNLLMNSSAYSWTDNTPYDFTEVIGTQMRFNCIAFNATTGLWNTADCNYAKAYVCKVPKSFYGPSYPNFENCTEGWTYFSPTHSCYGTGGPVDYKPWTDAETFCENLGGHLPSIHSWEELNFLSTLGNIYSTNLWTGLFSNDSGFSFKWSDGSPSDYLPWGKGYPSNYQSSCVRVLKNTIYNYDCSGFAYFVCQKPAI